MEHGSSAASARRSKSTRDKAKRSLSCLKLLIEAPLFTQRSDEHEIPCQGGGIGTSHSPVQPSESPVHNKFESCFLSEVSANHVQPQTVATESENQTVCASGLSNREISRRPTEPAVPYYGQTNIKFPVTSSAYSWPQQRTNYAGGTYQVYFRYPTRPENSTNGSHYNVNNRCVTNQNPTFVAAQQSAGNTENVFQ